jgi:CDP-2,3-bis-(O-geranylgeranyl)-sn-glycerol synthase
MHPLLVVQLLALTTVGNGAPVIATVVLQDRWAFPVDGHVCLADRQSLFGSSKTIRGVMLSIASATVAATLIGLPPAVGSLIGASAMVGDLCSSFVKRRLQLAPGSSVTGLDQVPESLLPCLAMAGVFPMTAIDIASTVILFSLGDIVCSRVLSWLHIRERPY